MKTQLFDMNFVLPPMFEMAEVVKGIPSGTHYKKNGTAFGRGGQENGTLQENIMKTYIFDMNFVLPPLIEMTEVEKDMPLHSALTFKLCDPLCWGVFGG